MRNGVKYIQAAACIGKSAVVKILGKIDVKSPFALGDPVWFSTGAFR